MEVYKLKGTKMMKLVKSISMAAVFFLAFLAMSQGVGAEGVNVSDALGKSGIKNTGNIDGVYDDLNGIVLLIMALGGFWIIGMLVWGGMTLAGSGGNPQKRTEGFIKLSMVLVGAWVIFKSYDIAGWATGLGGGVISLVKYLPM